MHPFVTKASLLVLSIGLVVWWSLEWAIKWVIKKAQSLASWLKFLLHCLAVLSLEAVRFIVVHGIEYVVVPALLLLVRVYGVLPHLLQFQFPQVPHLYQGH